MDERVQGIQMIVTSLPMPQMSSQCYVLGCSILGASNGNGYISFANTAFQAISPNGMLRISKIKLFSNLDANAFGGALYTITPGGVAVINTVDLSVRYNGGPDNLVFKKPLYVKHELDIDVNYWIDLAGDNPCFWLLPNITFLETASELAGNGIPQLHCLLTVEQSNNESFNQALRNGVA
jgi:hypothetical protein